MIGRVKGRIKGFLDYNVNRFTRSLATEIIFQRIFDQQCAQAGIRNDFYPVGAAASYGLMYLLFRILSEQPIQDFVELGSGQTTLLVDRLNQGRFRHVCYENDAHWHNTLRPRLKECDYRLRELATSKAMNVECDWYRDVEPQAFDVMLIDGPCGTENFSRIGCWQLIERNPRKEFLLIFDDAGRPGEQQTIHAISGQLRNTGRRLRVAHLDARARQTVIATELYESVVYFF